MSWWCRCGSIVSEERVLEIESVGEDLSGSLDSDHNIYIIALLFVGFELAVTDQLSSARNQEWLRQKTSDLIPMGQWLHRRC